MVHTLPDYTSKWRSNTISTNLDLGELAASLGSINTYDRRGNIVWMDDIESTTEKWDTATSGAGASAERSTDAAKNGDASFALLTGNAEEDISQMATYLPILVKGKLGFEFSFNIEADIGDVFAYMWFYDGTNLTKCTARYEQDTEKLMIYDETGNTVDVDAALPLLNDEYMWHTLKVVADFSTNKYTRILFNDTEYDISATSMQQAADATDPNIFISIKAVTGADSNEIVMVDDVIITQNEP